MMRPLLVLNRGLTGPAQEGGADFVVMSTLERIKRLWKVRGQLKVEIIYASTEVMTLGIRRMGQCVCKRKRAGL